MKSRSVWPPATALPPSGAGGVGGRRWTSWGGALLAFGVPLQRQGAVRQLHASRRVSIPDDHLGGRRRGLLEDREESAKSIMNRSTRRSLPPAKSCRTPSVNVNTDLRGARTVPSSSRDGCNSAAARGHRPTQTDARMLSSRGHAQNAPPTTTSTLQFQQMLLKLLPWLPAARIQCSRGPGTRTSKRASSSFACHPSLLGWIRGNLSGTTSA